MGSYAGVSTLYLIYKREPFEAVEREIVVEREDAEEPEIWEVVDSEHHSLDRQRIKKLRDLVSSGFKVTLHCPYDPWINIADKEPSRRKRSIMRIKGSIDAAAELEALSFNLHPGAHIGLPEDRKRLSALNTEAVASLYDYSESRGVALSLENMPPDLNYFMVTPDEFLNLEEDSGLHLRITFDPGHANLRGLVDDFVKALAERVSEVHVHDNRGVFDEHLEVGLGTINWAKILKELTNKGLSVNYVLETYEPPFKSLSWLKGQLSDLRKRMGFTQGT